MTGDGERRLPQNAFVGNETHWITPDRVYLMFAGHGILAGGRIGGQLMPRRGVYPVDPLAYGQPGLVERQLGVDPFSAGFLELDPKNFQLRGADIVRIQVSSRRQLWTGPIPNSGAVIVVPRNGRKRRFILLGEQDRTAIASLLFAAGLPASSPFAPG